MGRVNWQTNDVEKALSRIRHNQDFEAANRKPAAKKKKKGQEPEPDEFSLLVEKETGYSCCREHRFHPKRRWRFDYVIQGLMIAIECEGGVWSKGRHTRGTGYIKDMEKYNTAQTRGWVVLRFTPQQLQETATLHMIKAMIRERLKQHD